ncbi:MAG: acyl-CoA dehydrogenase family protein [Bacteroidales bacterium]
MEITDYFNIDEFLTSEHLLIRKSIRDWVNRRVKPIIETHAQNHESPDYLIKEMGELGILGSFIPAEYGGAGLDQISYGIIMQELEAGDSAIRSFASVQTSLVMFPIFEFGSEAQKKKYLPLLATGELIGCFGLTEPNHGSNPSGMESRISKKGKDYVLTGSKMWITNSPIADIAIIWARDDEGIVKGAIVEKFMKGYSAPSVKNKWSLRASHTGELVFDHIVIPEENILPLAKGLKAPLMCLNSARYGISWGVIGAALDCYNTTLNYALSREQFGVPIAGFQLTQKKLAEMLTELTKAQLLAWRLGTLKNENRATLTQISMTKRNNVKMALETARECRQILGAAGITSDFPVMRHLLNLESVITYEGTHEIHLLITGMDVTGISSFQA